MTRDAGFTIIESLVAFAILSVMLVTIYGAGGTALRGIERVEAGDSAGLLAQSKLAEIDASRFALPDHSEGRFAGSDVTWRMEAEDAGESHATLRVQDVHLVLSWRDEGEVRSLTLDTRHLGRRE